jgi:hypothetical protein
MDGRVKTTMVMRRLPPLMERGSSAKGWRAHRERSDM